MKIQMNKTILFLFAIFLILGCDFEQKPNNKSPEPIVESSTGEETTSAVETIIFPPALPTETQDQATRTLNKNWNLTSAPVDHMLTIAEFLEIYPKIQSIWQWLPEKQSWKTFPYLEGFELLEVISPEEGYWIRTEGEFDFAEQGSFDFKNKFSDGWNLLGYSHTQPTISTEEFFSQSIFQQGNCGNGIDLVNAWAWKDNSWQIFLPKGDLQKFNEEYQTNFKLFSTIQPGDAFWINLGGSFFPPSMDESNGLVGNYHISIYEKGVQQGLGILEVTEDGKIEGNFYNNQQHSSEVLGCLGNNGTFLLTELISPEQIGVGQIDDTGIVKGILSDQTHRFSFNGFKEVENNQNYRSTSTNIDLNLFDGKYKATIDYLNQQMSVDLSVQSGALTFKFPDSSSLPIFIGNLREDGTFLAYAKNRQDSIQGTIDPITLYLKGKYLFGSLFGSIAGSHENTPKNLVRTTGELKVSSQDINLFLDDGQSFVELPAIEESLEDTQTFFSLSADTPPPTIETVSSTDGKKQRLTRTETPAIPNLVEDAPSLGDVLNPEIDIEEFDETLGDWLATPKTIGTTGNDGWKRVKHEGEMAVRNESTLSEQNYVWKLSKAFNLTEVSEASFHIKYRYLGHYYEAFQIILHDQADNTSHTLHEDVTATTGSHELTLDLSKYTGKSVKIELLLQKPDYTIEQRTGLYIYRVGMITPKTSNLTVSAKASGLNRSSLSRQSVSSSAARLISPRNGRELFPETEFAWTPGNTKEVYLKIYSAWGTRFYDHKIYDSGTILEGNSDYTILIDIPGYSGLIRAHLQSVGYDGRRMNRYYYFYAPSPKIVLPGNRTVLGSENLNLIWQKGYAWRTYMRVYTSQQTIYSGYPRDSVVNLQVPTNQGIIYVGLWYYYNYRWRYRTYSYYPPTPEIISPAPDNRWFNTSSEFVFDRASASYLYLQTYNQDGNYIESGYLWGNKKTFNLTSDDTMLKMRVWYYLPYFKRWYFKYRNYMSDTLIAKPPRL